MQSEDYLNGQLLLIDKPLEWTSFDVVNKLRYALKKKLGIKKIKVGHAGTLDPLATGLLLVCTGRFTKQINELMGLPKVYTGTIRLGETTPSYDAETEVNERFSIDHITPALVEATTAQFKGEIDQIPPLFSAVKKDGERAYNLARKGEDTSLPSRRVHIHEFEIMAQREGEVDFRVKCSKGTYIRSLAHDFGKALNSGGYLVALRRTHIGDYAVSDSIGPLEFVEQLGS